MELAKNIRDIFSANCEVQKLVLQNLVPAIAEAASLLAKCLLGSNKVLTCGNGGSACDAAHFTTEIVGRFLVERDGLPAITLGTDYALLTAIANDYAYKDVFARQIKALGKKEDILLAISTSGNSANVVEAIHMAHKCDMRVIALNGRDGGEMAKVLTTKDLEIRIPAYVAPRIQEMHTLVVHCLCELVDKIKSEGNI